MSEFKKNHLSVQNLALLAVLIAVEIILSRFLSLSMWNMKFGFAFIALVFTARVMGPVEAMIVGGVSDLVGALLFPVGPYFPGFTFTAVLTGLIYALFLYKHCNLQRIIASVLLVQIVCTLFLNSLWISVLYGSPFLPLIVTRLPQAGIMAVIQVLLMSLIFIKGDKYIMALSPQRK